MEGQKHTAWCPGGGASNQHSGLGPGREEGPQVSRPAATRQMWSPEPGRTPPAASLPPSPDFLETDGLLGLGIPPQSN